MWKKHIPLLLCSVFIIIAAFNRGDFFHYFYMVRNYNPILGTHMEDFYNWLILVVNRNYLLWRIVIWGGAFLIFILSAKRLKINSIIAVFVLFVCFINDFNYSRFSLACAVYFFGLTFIIRPIPRTILSYVIGVALILSSQFFHASVTILIIATIVVFIPFNKRIALLAVVLIPLILRLLPSYYLDGLFLADSLTNVDVNQKVENYSAGVDGSSGKGIAAVFYDILHHGSFYLALYYSGRTIFKNEVGQISVQMVKLYKILFAIIFIASIIGMFYDANVFYYRVLYMSVIPMCLVLAYLQEERLINAKWMRNIYYLIIFSIIYNVMYNIYLK